MRTTDSEKFYLPLVLDEEQEGLFYQVPSDSEIWEEIKHTLVGRGGIDDDDDDDAGQCVVFVNPGSDPIVRSVPIWQTFEIKKG